MSLAIWARKSSIGCSPSASADARAFFSLLALRAERAKASRPKITVSGPIVWMSSLCMKLSGKMHFSGMSAPMSMLMMPTWDMMSS